MSIPLSTKISPLLRLMGQKSPIVPILVEGTPQTFYDILGIFDSLQLNIYQSIPLFGFVAGVAPREFVVDIAAQPEVLMVHPDMMVNQFSFPFGINLDVNPFDMVASVMDSTFGTINREATKTFYDTIMADPLGNVFSMFSPQNLMNPLDMPQQLLSQVKNTFGLSSLPLPFLSGAGLAQDREGEFFGYPTSYTRQLLELDKAEEIGLTGKGVKICVLDTGVDLGQQQISGTTDFDNAMTENPPIDSNGHGTHVSSTSFGLPTINYRNIALKGMAYDSIPIVIKVLGYAIGTGKTSDIIKGMEMAYLKRADIVNMSLGSDSCPPHCPMCRVIDRLTKEGMMFVVANGNSGDKPHTVGCPASAEATIAVGAVSPKDDKVAKFSSRGSTKDGRIKPDISSYGVDIYSGISRGSLLDGIGDKRIDGYGKLSGTSMATPHMTGLLAVVKQAIPELNTDIAKKIFAKHGIEKNNNTGWGIARWSWFEPYIKR